MVYSIYSIYSAYQGHLSGALLVCFLNFEVLGVGLKGKPKGTTRAILLSWMLFFFFLGGGTQGGDQAFCFLGWFQGAEAQGGIPLYSLS